MEKIIEQFSKMNIIRSTIFVQSAAGYCLIVLNQREKINKIKMSARVQLLGWMNKFLGELDLLKQAGKIKQLTEYNLVGIATSFNIVQDYCSDYDVLPRLDDKSLPIDKFVEQ